MIARSFREAMGWLHTWLGIALAAILFAVFWTGTLAVFDREIDQWMKPELRFEAPQDMALDQTVLPALRQLDIADGSLVWVGPPRERIPMTRVYYDDSEGNSHEVLLHPETGEVLEPTDSHAGTEFFFPFHYMLMLPGNWGYYLVGLASVGMMVLIVSGIFIHRKIFQEFFTFRPRKKLRRSTLDMHNLTALVALPFHFVMPFSGLLILIAFYFPWSMGVPHQGDLHQLDADLMGYEERRVEPAGVPGPPIASLDAYVQAADRIWRDAEGDRTSTADWIAVFNWDDANSYVVVERYFADRRVAIGPDQVVFDPRTGEVIDRFDPGPVQSVSNWIEGIHWVQFDHWPLRWLYFAGGLMGCMMIGSGLVFWMQARIRKNAQNPANVRFVRALTIGSTTGIIAASAAFLIANRLLPAQFDYAGHHRHDLELWAFFAVWLASFLHAAARDRAAWRDQCIAIGALGVACVALNWLTTGTHPIAVVMMDITILIGAAVAIMVARRPGLRTVGLREGNAETATASPAAAQ